MVRIKQLLINEQTAAMGVEMQPEIAWKLHSDKRGCYQAAYRLRVTDIAGQKTVFDSGWIEDSTSRGHTMPAGILQSAKKYHAEVCVRTKDGEISPWSEPVSFVTALSETWTAPFITGETAQDAESSGAMYLRREFNMDDEIVEAYAYGTALGVYEFYVNGQKVGPYRLAPGWTSYHKHLLYQTYDLTAFLHSGRNCFGALVGAGWYKGKMGFTLDRNHYGDRAAFRCQIFVRMRSGETICIGTDENWLAAPSGIVFSEIYDGETYDAEKEIPGWSTPECRTGTWRPVELLEYDAPLYPQQGACVTEYAKLPVKSIFQTPKGETVADFGQNLAGTVRFRAAGESGKRVVLTCFETLNREGNVYLDNLRTAKQTITYIFGDERDVEFQPHFTYQGFRYAWIREWPEESVGENALTAIGLCSQMEQTLQFHCSVPLVNRLVENIRWGMRSNFVDIPTDCPQRDERLGWTGDAQIFGRTAAYLMQTELFFRKWLTDVAADQTPEGGVPHVIPDIVSGKCADNWLLSQGEHSAAAWADAIVILPWDLYLMYGDMRTLKNMYDSMKKWVEFMHIHSVDNLWNYKLQFGDWLALDAAEGSYFGATPNVLVCTAYYAYVTGLFSKMAAVLHREEDRVRYARLYTQIVRKFRAEFFDEENHLKAQTQTAHILSLYFRLTPDPNKTAADLITLLRRDGNHLKTGFVGTPYFCFALAENGYIEEAYRLLLQTDIPSWLYQVRMGATTVWEHWDGVHPDGTMWSADMNSLNHYAYGAIGEWLFRGAAGIDTDENAPGFRRSILRPCVSRQMPDLETRYESPYGEIGVHWQLKEETVELHICVPENTTSVLQIERAKCMIDTDGVLFTKKAEGNYTAELSSGCYQFRYIFKD